MADYQYIGWGQDDGLIVGKSGESIGFLGATPTAVATVTSTAITAPTSTGGATYAAFATTAQADALCAVVAQIRAQLVALGLMSE